MKPTLKIISSHPDRMTFTKSSSDDHSVATILFILTGLLLAPPAALHAADTAPTQKPNILFIMVDEMKWNVMSCAGHTIVKTPHLDRLRAKGRVSPPPTPWRRSARRPATASSPAVTPTFTAPPTTARPPANPSCCCPPFSNTPATRPPSAANCISSRIISITASITSGRSPAKGPGKLPTWPQDVEKKHGRGAARRLEIQPFPDDPLGRDLGKLTYPKEDTQTFWITDRAVDFLRQRDTEKPFFLFVSYLDPHSPSHLCEPYWNMFDAEKMPLPPTFRQDPSKPSRPPRTATRSTIRAS